MIAVDILFDGVFAAVAAIGFGAISDPPVRAFPYIALLAAVGHALRFCLMSYAGIDIATASLCAAVVIGFGSLWLGRGIRCPMTVLYIPALLPMVPGIYAYKTVFALIMFLQSLNDPGQGLEYMQQFFPECHRVVQRDYPVGCGRYAADIHLQPPGFLAHTTQTEPQVNSFRMDVFWNTIAAYNAATWPVQLLLVAVAAVLTLLALPASDACGAYGDEGFYGRIEFLDRGRILFSSIALRANITIFWPCSGRSWAVFGSYDLAAGHDSLGRTGTTLPVCFGAVLYAARLSAFLAGPGAYFSDDDLARDALLGRGLHRRVDAGFSPSGRISCWRRSSAIGR